MTNLHTSEWLAAEWCTPVVILVICPSSVALICRSSPWLLLLRSSHPSGLRYLYIYVGLGSYLVMKLDQSAVHQTYPMEGAVSRNLASATDAFRDLRRRATSRPYSTLMSFRLSS